MKILIRNIILVFRAGKRRLNKFIIINLIKDVGAKFVCDEDVVVYGGGHIVIGERVVINRGVLLQSCDGARIEIGNNVTLSYDVKIITGNLSKKSLDIKNNRGHNSSSIQIGDNVWIGASVIILPGVSIANNTIIAAGSIVNKTIKNPGALYAGSPAKFIKKI